MGKNINDCHEFKPILNEIEDAPQNPLGRIIFWVIVAAILFFGLWMFFGQVDVVVSARGKMIPRGEIKVLQPLTAGVVRSILVQEGDLVAKGQVLMEIDPSNIEPEMESKKANLNQLDLEIMRLGALLAGKGFSPDPASHDMAMIKVQQELYQSSIDRLGRQVEVKKQELAQITGQRAGVREGQAQARYLLAVSRKRLGRLEEVRDIISRDEYDKAVNEVKGLESEIATAGYLLQELDAAAKRIAAEIELILEDEKNRHSSELAKKQMDRSSLEAELEKSAYLHDCQQIISPVDGYVNKLFIHTESGVVAPAEKLVAIVPIDSPLVVKAMVRNQDVGFISQGMGATLKIDTFNFQKYGIVDGTVSHVSRDSMEDEALGLVYEVYVEPATTSLMVEGVDTPITTGMSLTSEIRVGKRRIIEFFIYPLIKYLDEGMSVR